MASDPDGGAGSLPACLLCTSERLGFPCRGPDGSFDPARLMQAYLRRYRSLGLPEGESQQRYEEMHWAYDCMEEAVESRPALALDAILVGLDFFVTDEERAFLAAGPLEDLLTEQGPAMIDRIEREAARDPRFRYLLSGIWGEPHCDPSVWRRIQDLVQDGPWLCKDPRTPQGSRRAKQGG